MAKSEKEKPSKYRTKAPRDNHEQRDGIHPPDEETRWRENRHTRVNSFNAGQRNEHGNSLAQQSVKLSFAQQHHITGQHIHTDLRKREASSLVSLYQQKTFCEGHDS